MKSGMRLTLCTSKRFLQERFSVSLTDGNIKTAVEITLPDKGSTFLKLPVYSAA